MLEDVLCYYILLIEKHPFHSLKITYVSKSLLWNIIT